ncbi:MAG: proton-conducting transporter membrane subunit, partial [Chloroflexota bacterium]
VTLQAIVAGTSSLSPGLAMGLGFMTTGVAFKIAAVPFHYWTPDAYQGSPTPVTGYLSVGPKIGAFAPILRLFIGAPGALRADWLQVVVVLAILTMTLGNLVALTQTNVKRMLAYSSIAHTGYMLVGLAAFAAGRVEGLQGLLYYGAAYSFMNLGAFAVIAASADLLVLFVALELMVLPGYMLAGYHKTDGYSTEGAIKYFLLGSFSSAIFLFGLAFTWGATGTTSIAGVSAALQAITSGGAAVSPALVLGLGFLTTGVAFKIAAVPFHYWTPDAYQGSPTPVTGYLSVGPKVGAFALILRLFVDALGPLRADWLQVVIILAVLTMTLGNLVALTQNNVKRMLAYSSIAHTGYMLVGLAAFAAGRIEGLEGLLYYGAAYSVMNLGAFAVVAAIQRRAGVTSGLDTFAGLARREPWLA